MFRTFKSEQIITPSQVQKMYPNSMFLIRNCEGLDSTSGVLLAVSTNESSYKDLCEMMREMTAQGTNCFIAGTYKQFDWDYKEFNEPRLYTYKEVIELYPRSMFILAGDIDVNDIKGMLIAVSTNESTFMDICKKRSQLEQEGIMCLLAGSYMW